VVSSLAPLLAWVATLFGSGQPPPPDESAASPVPITVAATGDLLIHTPVAARALVLGGGSRYDFAPLFARVRRHIAGADIALCHVETPLVPGPVAGYPSFRTPPALAGSIRRVGWDACSTASNHSLDAGSTGIRTTLQALDRAGVAHAGTARSPAERRRTAMLSVSGIEVALLSYTAVSNGQAVPSRWAVNFASPPAILADARRARRRGADVVIANLHWGSEYVSAVTPDQAALARRLTRSPAIDAIVGQHAHVVQPVRRVNGRPVVFGEGNLVSNQTPACCPAASQDGLIALIDMVAEEGAPARTRRVRYLPTWVSHPDYSVLPAPPGSASRARTVAVAGKRPGIRPLAAR
jgi:poly-gamma-glutamate synthesis protein (capsule biosynthesis protein)